MRKYRFIGTDGFGSHIKGETKKEYNSMAAALVEEIYRRVHSCLKCEAI